MRITSPIKKLQIASLLLLSSWAMPSALSLPANTASQGSPPYSAVEVDPFVPDTGVAFPVDYQGILLEDIAREISVDSPTVLILRLGQHPPSGYRLLRIVGVITKFKPGNRSKRFLIGFGAGATIVRVQVSFADGLTGHTLLSRELEGMTWTGVGGGDSRSAANGLAKKIAKLCKSARLLESH